MIVWDIEKIGEDTTEADNMDGPSEIIFKHKGHEGMNNISNLIEKLELMIFVGVHLKR